MFGCLLVVVVAVLALIFSFSFRCYVFHMLLMCFISSIFTSLLVLKSLAKILRNY